MNLIAIRTAEVDYFTTFFANFGTQVCFQTFLLFLHCLPVVRQVSLGYSLLSQLDAGCN